MSKFAIVLTATGLGLNTGMAQNVDSDKAKDQGQDKVMEEKEQTGAAQGGASDTLRPSQLRASAAESALMVPAAIALRGRYQELTMPVIIMAGAGIASQAQSGSRPASLNRSRKVSFTSCLAQHT